MKPKYKILTVLTSAMALSLGTAQSATLFPFEFNGSGTEGWSANTAVAGFGQFTSSTSEGVISSTDITGNDPQISYGTTLALPAGETWGSIEIRYRQLGGNPPGGSGIEKVTTGQIIIFNSSAGTNNGGAWSTGTYNGAGALAGDVFTKTAVDGDAGNGFWNVFTVDFSAAPTFNSQDITAIRLDPVGNDDTKNFEIDYVRVTTVPEPTSALLLGFAASLGLIRRRR